MQTAWVDISIPFRVCVGSWFLITNDLNKSGSDEHQLVVVGQQVVEGHAAVDRCSDHGSLKLEKKL